MRHPLSILQVPAGDECPGFRHESAAAGAAPPPRAPSRVMCRQWATAAADSAGSPGRRHSAGGPPRLGGPAPARGRAAFKSDGAASLTQSRPLVAVTAGSTRDNAGLAMGPASVLSPAPRLPDRPGAFRAASGRRRRAGPQSRHSVRRSRRPSRPGPAALAVVTATGVGALVRTVTVVVVVPWAVTVTSHGHPGPGRHWLPGRV